MSYQNIKDKLYHGHRKLANNTYLRSVIIERTFQPDEEWIEMSIHGNIIAEFYPDHLRLYACGWYTNTTKSRLNLALKLAGIQGRIYQQDYEWYYSQWYYDKNDRSSSISFKDGMKISYTGEVSPIEVLE